MLHTIYSSPYATASLSQCLRYAPKQSVILLVEDAVVAAVGAGQWYSQLITSGYEVYVLLDDVEARGLIGQISNEFKLINIQGFVELTERHVTQVKW